MREALIETVQIFEDAFNDPVSSSIAHCTAMYRNYFAFKTKQDSADVCFQVEDKQIWAHKAILEARCQHFQLMLHPRWHESDKE